MCHLSKPLHPASPRLQFVCLFLFIVLYKSKIIVGQLGPKEQVRMIYCEYTKSPRVKNEEGRSTEYSEGTILANIDRLVALTYFPQKVSRISQAMAGVTPQYIFEPKRSLESTLNPTILLSPILPVCHVLPPLPLPLYDLPPTTLAPLSLPKSHSIVVLVVSGIPSSH